MIKEQFPLPLDDKTNVAVQELLKGKSYIHEYAAENKLYDKIPNIKIKKLLVDPKECITISGPYNKMVAPSNFHQAYGQTISTYPMCTGKSVREGDPICDSYKLQTYKNCQVVCIADGCGWGERPKEASNRLRDSFLYYFEDKFKSLKSLSEIASHLVTAFAFANHYISYDKDNIWMAGTSTALGGLIVELEREKNSNLPPWAFVFITIGDCKCFKWDASQRVCSDITVGNRIHITDARDPGGRLGPQKKNGAPDLRNLDLYWVGCNEGDIIIAMSDGVHDNLDPQSIGLPPTNFGLVETDWEHVEPNTCTTVKTKHMNQLITEIITTDYEESSASHPLSNPAGPRPVIPALIAKRLVRYCLDLTKNARQWMEQNPQGTLDSDYQKYPGKLDHTTCVACQVGLLTLSNEEPTDSGALSRSLKPEVWPF